MLKYYVSVFGIIILGYGCESDIETPNFESQTKAIVAAQGGTLTLSDGASVVIPADALQADSTVEFKRLECPPNFRTSRFGTCPYEVTLDVDLLDRAEIHLPNNAQDSDCLLADTDLGWRCLVDSENSDGEVKATFSTSRQFTTNVSAGDLPITACTDAPFKDCGGDLLGSWVLVSACGTQKQLSGSYSEGPARYPGCAVGEHYRAEVFTINEVMEVAAGGAEAGSGGTLNTTGSGRTVTHDITTIACMATEGDECTSPVCESHDGVCECLFESGQFDTTSGRGWSQDEQGSYFIDESTSPLEYCVRGDSLTIQFDHPDGKYQKIYTRK